MYCTVTAASVPATLATHLPGLVPPLLVEVEAAAMGIQDIASTASTPGWIPHLYKGRYHTYTYKGGYLYNTELGLFTFRLFSQTVPFVLD